jgi:hypothetical protein
MAPYLHQRQLPVHRLVGQALDLQAPASLVDAGGHHGRDVVGVRADLQADRVRAGMES